MSVKKSFSSPALRSCVGQVLFNPPIHARWRVEENPPYERFHLHHTNAGTTNLFTPLRDGGLKRTARAAYLVAMRNCKSLKPSDPVLMSDNPFSWIVGMRSNT